MSSRRAAPHSCPNQATRRSLLRSPLRSVGPMEPCTHLPRDTASARPPSVPSSPHSVPRRAPRSSDEIRERRTRRTPSSDSPPSLHKSDAPPPLPPLPYSTLPRFSSLVYKPSTHSQVLSSQLSQILHRLVPIEWP